MKAKRVLVYTTLVAAAAFAVGQTWPELLGRAAYAVERGQALAAREQLKQARDLSEAFQSATQAITPSVVNIRSIRKVAMNSGRLQPPLAGRTPFGDGFLQRFFGDRLERGGGQEFVQRGVGTGVIVSGDGYIVTNNHVVDGASDVAVTLSDDRTFDAEVIGVDEKTDLAILKIDAPELLPAELGDSTEAKIGEWVLAVGNPFGLDHTVTAGIISATGRSNVGITDYEDFLQTDAAINPGNSGGPLVNLAGEVIGINTAIATNNGRYQGVGFAIPATMVRQVMDAILTDGKVVRGWLGVMIQDLNGDLARSFGFDGDDGVLIGDVLADGPAERAGLQAGDIVVALDGEPVHDMNRFRNRVAAVRPGATVELDLFRDGDAKHVTVEIGELESRSLAVHRGGDHLNLGMQTRDLTPDIAQRLNLRSIDRGVVVTQVEAGGMAERAGLRMGDLITAVGSEPVSNLAEFRRALAQRDLSDGVRLRVLAGEAQRFVFLKE